MYNNASGCISIVNFVVVDGVFYFIGYFLLAKLLFIVISQDLMSRLISFNNNHKD